MERPAYSGVKLYMWPAMLRVSRYITYVILILKTCIFICLFLITPLNAELNPIYHLLALLGGATIVVFSMLRVKSVHQ
jgi:hypothetical protein